MPPLWDFPLAIAAIAVVLGTAFAAAVYGGSLVSALIFGACVGVGAFVGMHVRITQQHADERRADVDGPDDT